MEDVWNYKYMILNIVKQKYPSNYVFKFAKAITTNILIVLVEEIDGIPIKSERFTLKQIHTILRNDKLERIKSDNEVLMGWKLPAVSLDTVRQAINELVRIIEEQNKLLPTEKIINEFKQKDFFQKKS